MKRADQRKFHYIYKITRLDDSGKYYIGLHSTDDVEDGYFGSGQLLWKSIKKHGKDKHLKVILEFLPSRAEVKLRERELIGELWKTDPQCMNLAPGGEGGEITESGIERLRNKTVSQETRNKMSMSAKKKPAITQTTRDKMSVGQTGRLHSEATKQKIAASNRKPKDPAAVRRSAEARSANMTQEVRVKLGSNRGKVMPAEQKAKIAASVQKSITPELRAKASARAKTAWTPERKALHAEKIRAAWAARRAT